MNNFGLLRFCRLFFVFFFGGGGVHHKYRLYFGVNSMQFRIFLKVNGEFILFFGGCLKFLIFFG